MDAVTTRFAQVADASSLAVFHVEAWQSAYRGILPDSLLTGMSVDNRERSWRQILLSGGVVCVAEANRRLVGFSSYGANRDADQHDRVGELFALYVCSSQWGTGIGHVLHDQAITALALQGYAEATLWVLAENVRARRFYERQLWRSDGTAKTEHRGEVVLNEVRYRKTLFTR